MNLNYIQGVLEFYEANKADKVRDIISKSGEHNFFNLSFNEVFLINHGSILIPFAKAFRSDRDDIAFLNEQFNSMIGLFSSLDVFSLDVYLEAYERNMFRILLTFDNGQITLSKYVFENISLKQQQIQKYIKGEFIQIID